MARMTERELAEMQTRIDERRARGGGSHAARVCNVRQARLNFLRAEYALADAAHVGDTHAERAHNVGNALRKFSRARHALAEADTRGNRAYSIGLALRGTPEARAAMLDRVGRVSERIGRGIACAVWYGALGSIVATVTACFIAMAGRH